MELVLGEEVFSNCGLEVVLQETFAAALMGHDSLDANLSGESTAPGLGIDVATPFAPGFEYAIEYFALVVVEEEGSAWTNALYVLAPAERKAEEFLATALVFRLLRTAEYEAGGKTRRHSSAPRV